MRYRLRHSFNKNCVITGKPHRPAITSVEKQPTQLTDNLKEKLKNQKLELLATIGEIEEYELIANESSQPNDHIQNLYNRARDHYSKTRGRIRALESLISYQ